jgi:hypothetical protein
MGYLRYAPFTSIKLSGKRFYVIVRGCRVHLIYLFDAINDDIIYLSATRFIEITV